MRRAKRAETEVDMMVSVEADEEEEEGIVADESQEKNNDLIDSY